GAVVRFRGGEVVRSSAKPSLASTEVSSGLIPSRMIAVLRPALRLALALACRRAAAFRAAITLGSWFGWKLGRDDAAGLGGAGNGAVRPTAGGRSRTASHRWVRAV